MNRRGGDSAQGQRRQTAVNPMWFYSQRGFEDSLVYLRQDLRPEATKVSDKGDYLERWGCLGRDTGVTGERSRSPC